MEIKKASKLDPKSNLIFLITNEKELPTASFTKEELSFIKKELKNEHKQVEINRLNSYVFVILCDKENDYKAAEKIRISASNLLATLNNKKIAAATVVGTASKLTPFIEGIGLGNYQFLKYYSDKKENTFQQLTYITSDKKENIDEVIALIVATNHARDLVNEPLSYLTAEQLSKEIKVLGKTYGFKVEVLTKAKVEALQMGGVLAVNKGSLDPPTFSILEWKPAKPKNKKPVILVGRGVVYDTGGLSLKPTPNSMDMMKCD